MSRKILQAENVGPDGNSLFVLRLVATTYLFAVEVVDVRGRVVYKDTGYRTEMAARVHANQLWVACRQANGYREGVL
jgi:hypothetical protein